MKEFLTSETRQELRKRHRTERDRRIADRIKAVLLADKGWSFKHIAEVLLLDEDTISQHVQSYIQANKLKPENGGSFSKLDDLQAQALAVHIEVNSYVKVSDICAYVTSTYGVVYSVGGMTNWLKRMGFSYKKPKATPSKADPTEQESFIKAYQTLMNTTPEDEPILFGDGVHPTMATKVSYGWIRKGVDKPIAATASKTRMNLLGALNLQTMEVTVREYETLDQEAMADYLGQIRQTYPKASKIHMILDRGPYNISKKTKEAAKKYGIVLHFLPPYSPNLNPIERLWKVMNEMVRNNRFFESAKNFKEAIKHFFSVTWLQISMSMVDRINDNFQTLKPKSSC